MKKATIFIIAFGDPAGYSILKELIDNIKDDEEIVIDENGIKKVKRANEQY